MVSGKRALRRRWFGFLVAIAAGALGVVLEVLSEPARSQTATDPKEINTTQFWDGAATGQMRPWARNRLDPNCPASDLFRQEITIALCSSSRERGPNNAGLAPRHSSRCYYMRCEEPCACQRDQVSTLYRI